MFEHEQDVLNAVMAKINESPTVESLFGNDMSIILQLGAEFIPQLKTMDRDTLFLAALKMGALLSREIDMNSSPEQE